MCSERQVWLVARKTALDKLNEAISGILQEYADDVSGNLEEIVKELGKNGTQALKAKTRETFPVDKGRKISGDYARGWKYKVDNERLNTTVTIYNDHPALPHLLENGHVSRNGTKRTFGRVPGYPHIKPVEDELVATFEREVVSKL